MTDGLPHPPAGGAGTDFIAEPSAIGDGTYQVGNFPAGWSEWNGIYRDTLRKHQNKLGVETVTPGAVLATRFASSLARVGPVQVSWRPAFCSQTRSRIDAYRAIFADQREGS